METIMRVIKRHKRCPHCNQYHTRKHGFIYRKKRSGDKRRLRVLRWYCHLCKRAFIERRHINRLGRAVAATKHYFVGRASYRNTARLLHINRATAYSHIQSICQRTKMPWELSQELKPSWSGYLLIDSDAITVGSRQEYLITAVDSATRDIPAAILCRTQSADDWGRLLEMLIDLNYPFKAFVTDGYIPLISALKAYFSRLPHQQCIKHFYDETYRAFRYRPSHKHIDMQRTKLFMDLLHPVLFARSYSHHAGELNHLLNHPTLLHPDFKEPLYRLHQFIPYLRPHFFDRNIPRTTNIIENVFSQLDLKLNPSIKFATHESAWNTIKCLISWYRFKRFSNCRPRYRHHNGKAPLELAGVMLPQTPWIYQAMRRF